MGCCSSKSIPLEEEGKNSLLAPKQQHNASDSAAPGAAALLDPHGMDNIGGEGSILPPIYQQSNAIKSGELSSAVTTGTTLSSSHQDVAPLAPGTTSAALSKKMPTIGNHGKASKNKNEGKLDLSSHSQLSQPDNNNNSSSHHSHNHPSSHHHHQHHHHTRHHNNHTTNKPPLTNNDQWTHLFHSLSPHILDPQDLPSTLDAVISRMINTLSPTEVSFIRKRVRDAARSIIHSTDGNGGDNAANNNSSGGGGSSSARSSLSAKVGRLVGATVGGSKDIGNKDNYNYNSNSNNNNNSSSNNNNNMNSTHHSALDESGGTKSSKALFQKERVLDISIMRKVFEGGDRSLRALQATVKAELLEDGGNGNTDHGGSSSLMNGGGGGGGYATDKNLPPLSSRRRGSSKTSTHTSGHGGAEETSSSSPPHPKDLDRDALEKMDIYGSAFLLLLYMSELRWDYVTEIAKLSAMKAGLTMDVNKLTLAEAKISSGSSGANNVKMNGSDGKSESSSSQHTTTTIIPPPPPTPSFTPPSELYNLPDLTVSNEPGGIHFSSLCYLIAMALRGTRRQKLNLLFFLLLPPKELVSILASLPEGGLPTWLLEVDEEVVLSYSSLSYYNSYEGVMLPFVGRQSSSSGASTSCVNGLDDGGQVGAAEFSSVDEYGAPRKKLCIDAKSAVEVIATLMCETSEGSLESSFASDKASDKGVSKEKVRRRRSDYGMRGLEKMTKSVDRAKGDESLPVNTLSSMKCQHVNEMLQGGPILHPSPHEMAQIETFLTVSSAAVPKLSTATTPESRLVWSMKEFVEWANDALDDSLLDVVMRHLFGTGILPCSKMERKLVAQRWLDWDLEDLAEISNESEKGESTTPARGGFRKMFGYNASGYEQETPTLPGCGFNRVWGGIGGADGKGGLGNGVLYCTDKKWWNDWVAYTGWQFGDIEGCDSRSLKRPRELSTERLIDRSPEASFVAGTRGSYELMKSNVQPGKDYVLVPPGVWNVLYEIYGGGPPLPRMVLPHENNDTRMNGVINGVVSVEDDSVEIVNSKLQESLASDLQWPKEIPKSVRVVTHPWVIHCQICDPQQPYRRGDAGPISIRLMATPDQPLWRLFAEIFVRLPISHAKARDANGEGRARLWKFDFVTGKAPNASSRYGPWTLLCKNRLAEIPITTPMSEKFEERWKSYADQHSVESIGLSDGTRIMFEYAMANKDGSFLWPREAAAKATRLRRIADEDAAFRFFLRGLDTEGKPLDSPIIRKLVDAMDSSGRWYQAVIANIDNTTILPGDEIGTEGAGGNEAPSDEMNREDSAFRENTYICVHFNDHAGNHEEWIDVKSDRLAVAGRFTAGSVQNMEIDLEGDDSTPNEGKLRLSGANKKKDETSTNDPNSNALCVFPSYGACGLVNLGNTCYANSGWQCMSYLPLLRSYLLSGQFKISGDINKDNPLGTGGKLLEEFSDLMRVMWSGKYGVRAPQKFRNFLGKCRPQYSGADQQDAQELLNDMIDMLHEDGNRVKKKPYVEALEDKWVEKTNLPRVGQEAWRRFLRRNRSAISDLAMGQVYNRVTCPVCSHSSKNFDPFNMLSLPFPTVAEVIFQCTVVRRATALNCPGTLLWVGKSHRSKDKVKADGAGFSPPSKELIFEQYIIPMSRLADMGDLKMKLQNVSGIPTNHLRICKKEDVVSGCGGDETSVTRVYTRVSALPDKEGPCVKLLQQAPGDDITSPTIAEIVAFETTLSLRPPIEVQAGDNAASTSERPSDAANDDDSTADDMSSDSSTGAIDGVRQSKILEQTVHEFLKVYGDENECVVYDTNPTPLSKYVSRSLWPKTTKDFTLGLRVDAIDHRNHWFPGSVIEIIEGTDSPENGEKDNDTPPKTKVKVHFDNFSAKWDEVYSIDSFNNGRVCPLYSHASPRSKPTEFVVHHRCIDRATKKFYLFGQSFYLQCHNEWSTARAGAHILAQASRFLEVSHFLPTENGKTLNAVDRKLAEKERLEARKVIANIIEALIKNDREYIQSAIDSGEEAKKNKDHTPFDVSGMSSILSKKLNHVLPLLPFDVRVTTADSPLGTNKEEAPFPFSLVRTIGNYMNARHSLVLHWREKPDNTKSSKSSKKHSEIPRQFLYTPPFVVAHKQSHAQLNTSVNADGTPKPLRRHASTGHGGMNIGVCLTEFCKEQQLDAADCWRCPVCKVDREGKQSMALWNLPDLLTFHLKRFNASSRWREKITTKVDFPLTGLNMRQWCDTESPLCEDEDDDSFIYDLVGVVNHYGGMTGGHYVAMCKATGCSPDGSEDVAYSFNGAGAMEVDAVEEGSAPSGWRLGRSKDKDSSSNAASKAVSESAEPLWLQFDDDLVEPLPPRNVVSETAYVVFYRRRRMHPANIAKYSSMD